MLHPCVTPELQATRAQAAATAESVNWKSVERRRAYVYYTYMPAKARKKLARRKLTITVEDAVYRGLRKIVGPRNISRFLNDLARPHVVRERLDEAYHAMADDEAREAEAAAWSEELVGDVADEAR